MKKTVVRLTVGLLTFTVGVICSTSPRVISSYRSQVLHSRQAVLHADLMTMRNAIDQYTAENRTPPRSLKQLVETGYLREIPIDPMTEKKDWEEVSMDFRGQFDFVILQDVHSASKVISSKGSPYSEW
jgi:general secretion pathway protein G